MQRTYKTRTLEITLFPVFTRFLNTFSNHDNSGLSFYYNDLDLIVEPYDSIKKQYYCGKELKTYIKEKTVLYTILTIDLSSVLLVHVYSDGEIKTLYKADSWIDNKQGSGGQSAARFQRLRQGQIIQWYKQHNAFLLTQELNNIILDMQIVYSKQFLEQLHSYNKPKITRLVSSGYSGSISGVYQTIAIIEKEKKNTTI